MRKIYSLFLVLLALSSCTISIEDELLPPERQGFDKICTVNNEYGELSYQFQDSVLYVTERVQEHIRLIDDSTFVYDASTPKEWRPYVGARLAASCSHTIPFGLNNRVVSVTPTGEGLLVHTERTTIEDVYKTLEYEFDYDLKMPDVTAHTHPDTLRALGFELRPDSTLFYWGDYDAQRSRALGLDNRSSRAENEFEDGEDADSKETHSLMSLCLDTRDISLWKKVPSGINQTAGMWSGVWFEIGTTMRDAVKKQQAAAAKKGGFISKIADNIYAAFNLDISSVNKVHFMRKEKTYPKIEENWTDTYYQFDAGVEVGYELEKSAGKTDPKKIGEAVDWRLNNYIDGDFAFTKSFYDDVFKSRDLMQDMEAEDGGVHLLDKNVKFFFFTVGPVPFNFALNASVDLVLSLKAMAALNCSYTTATNRNGERVEVYADGTSKKTPINKEIAKGHSSVDNLQMEGSVEAGFKVRSAIALEMAGSLGADIGCKFDAGAKASVTCMKTFDPKGTEKAFDYEGNLNLYAKGGLDSHIYIAPFGIKVFDWSPFELWSKTFYNKDIKIGPTIPYVMAVASSYGKDETVTVSGSYELRDEGLLRFIPAYDLTPQMRLYFGNYSPESTEYVNMTPVLSDYETPAPSSQTIDKKTFYFKWKGMIPPGNVHCTVVPAYFVSIDKEGKEPFLFSEYAKVIETGIPDISIVSDYTRQTYGGPYERNEFDFTDDGSAVESFADVNASNSGYGASVDPADLSIFKVMTTAVVRNGTYIKSWGLKLQVYDSKGKRYMSKKIPMSPNTSGVYTLVADFYSNWNAGKATYPDDHYFTFTPYWTDDGGVHHTGTTSSKKMLQFRAEDTTPGKNQSTYGKMTEKNIK